MDRTITINLDTLNITTTGDFTLPEALTTATYLTGYYVGAISEIYGPQTATQCAQNLTETWNHTRQHLESDQWPPSHSASTENQPPKDQNDM